jgi:DNA-binding LacI/PurR family transcriptional regulator
VIFFDRVPEEPGYNNVCQPDEAAARMAAEKIISRNKKNVLALFGHPHLSITKKRQDSFTGTFAAHAPGVNLSIEYPENIKPSHDITLQYLQQPNRPDVIFVGGYDPGRCDAGHS